MTHKKGRRLGLPEFGVFPAIRYFGGMDFLGEEFAEGFFDDADFDYLDAEAFFVEGAAVVARDKYFLESEAVGLGYALLYPADGTYLAR